MEERIYVTVPFSDIHNETDIEKNLRLLFDYCNKNNINLNNAQINAKQDIYSPHYYMVTVTSYPLIKK